MSKHQDWSLAVLWAGGTVGIELEQSVIEQSFVSVCACVCVHVCVGEGESEFVQCYMRNPGVQKMVQPPKIKANL